MGIEDHGDEPNGRFPGADEVFSAAGVVKGRLYAAGIAFFSATLLFSIQPHLGRRLLPTVGGGPAVWNACLVFFQTALLVGYGYSFLLIRRFGKWAWAIHAVSLVAGCVWLFAMNPSVFAGGGSPTLRTIISLAAIAGIPVVVLSATAPLAHHWNPDSSNRFGVYAASNAGSLFALVAYPILVEPTIGLGAQGTAWRWGFIVFTLLTGAFSWRRDISIETVGIERRSSFAFGRLQLTWLFWSALPSAILVSSTQRMTEDVAGGPMLWLPPLVCFLFASILAFSNRSPSLFVFAWLLPPLLLMRGAVLSVSALAPTLWVHLAVELVVLFLAAWCSFAVLYSTRPPDDDAAGFYLWLALGGAIGGVLSSVVAPQLFRSTAEHPLALILLCLLLPDRSSKSVCAAIVAIGAAALVAFGRSDGSEAVYLEWLLLIGSVGMLLAVGVGRSPALGLAIGAPLAVAMFFLRDASDRRVIFAERSEFGVHRVVEIHDDEGTFHAIRHGGVVHGWQCLDEGRTQQPIGYYHPDSAVGEALAWNKATSGGGDVAVVGLGAGAALVHRRPDQRFVFFEIDPTVVRIARDRRLFTYLHDATNGVEISIGDGRLLLEQTPDGSFSTIFLDAFGGDNVPTHLLTHEAFAMYLTKLKSDGVIVVNITNWFVDLEATVVRVGESVGLTAVGKRQTSERNEVRPGMAPTTCVVLAGNVNRLGSLASQPEWRRLSPTPKSSLWTDDYCDLWSVVRSQ